MWARWTAFLTSSLGSAAWDVSQRDAVLATLIESGHMRSDRIIERQKSALPRVVRRLRRLAVYPPKTHSMSVSGRIVLTSARAPGVQPGPHSASVRPAC
jgi:hypothetical protein